jgi:hypothetical protein
VARTLPLESLAKVTTMASSPRSQREEERRRNVRTLVIASVASAGAATITSQLWIAGTWIAAAATPVLVTLISELLHRPTEKLAQAWTSDRPALRPGAVREPVRVLDVEEPRGRPGPAGPRDPVEPGPLPPRELGTPRFGEPGQVRVYRGTSGRPPRRKIAFGVVAATAAIAFVIGVVLFTTTELLAGEPIGKADGRTTIGIGGGGKKDSDTDADKQQDERSPSDIGERPEGQERPSTQQEEEQPPTTTPQTTPTTPTAPEQTTPQPTPAPQQAPAPPPTQTAPAP